MKIIDVYTKFGISPNLVEHMLRVTAVVASIKEHWVSEILIDWDKLVRIALLHDLGNIVKFDFNKHPEFLGEEEKNADYWQKIQREIVQKYGADDHEATKNMLAELKVDEESIEVILAKSFGNSVAIKNSDNWLLKILAYADMRVLPFGIGSLEDRIRDIKERMPKYTSRPDFDDLVFSTREIEKQIQTNIDISTDEINDKTVMIDKSFLQLEL